MAATSPNDVRDTRQVTIDVDNVPLATVLHLIAQQVGLIPIFTPASLPAHTRVTLHVRDVPVATAFEQALQGTGLTAERYGRMNVAIVPIPTTAEKEGTIIGRVVDTRTKLPLRGVRIGLDGNEQAVETAGDGTYRLAKISAGSHTLTAKLLGYTRVVRPVQVQENSATVVDVMLELSATPLDQVVVTGTVVQTELKAVPNAMTVITAKQLEERGITRIDQLFRGDVPGLFAQNQGSNPNGLLDAVTMFSRGATSLNVNSPTTSAFVGFTNPIKTYVDGVELADPKYLSQLDPKSIERIEILTGPQASTIYGSNAINGVMQVFTKRGITSYPQLTLNLLSGFVQNNFSNALTPQHEYSGALNGIEGRLSYNAGGSWNYIGPWTPAKQTTRTSAFGGTRLDVSTGLGRIAADVTFRRNITQNTQRGNVQQMTTRGQETGWYSVSSSSGLSSPTTYLLTGQTLGLTLNYVPMSWWAHEFGIGQDVSDTEVRTTRRGYATRADTTLSFSQGQASRSSLRYTTTLRMPITVLAQATVTLGADAWRDITSSLTVAPQTLTGTLTGAPAITRQPGHNTGGFIQAQLGMLDQLFLTYGLRAEWNPSFGAAVQPNYAPRYGIAYTREFGMLTTKLRGSYGRSTRPPDPTFKKAQTPIDVYGPSASNILGNYASDYGNYAIYLANSQLGPEHQQGGEGGLEMYFSTYGSFTVTRYNQTVAGLIAAPKVDSVRSFLPDPSSFFDNTDPSGYGYAYQYQYLNIASIRNQGWEMQGNINMGPWTTKGTYSWTKGRSIGVTPTYRASFTPDNYPQYQPGATFNYLPEHTWAVGVTYAHMRTMVGLNITGVGRVRNDLNDFFLQNLVSLIRLPQNRGRVSNPFAYTNFNNGYALADVTVSRGLGPRAEGVLQLQNVMDRYTNDLHAGYATMGRQAKFGARVRF